MPEGIELLAASNANVPQANVSPGVLFDTHAHYDDGAFDNDRDELLARLPACGIGCVINIGYDIASSEAGRCLAGMYGHIWFTAGIHPHNAAGAPENFETRLSAILTDEKAVALGEIGLDYYYDHSPRARQREVFARQLVLAGERGAPVVIHDRDAHDDIIDILHAHRGLLNGGVMHCFSGGRELAAKALDLGLYIAFGGALTFKNAHELAGAAAFTPRDRLLLETDCPYLSPVPYRGRRNDSTRLGIIADRLARIRGVSVADIAEATAENAKMLFLSP